MEALLRLRPGLEFLGRGGPRMEAAGLRRIVRAEDVAVMGITEILRHVPRIWREYRRLRRALWTEKPDVLVLIDFPDVNLGLAKRAKQLGIPVVFFVSPQVWAWKGWRIGRIRRDVDRMLVIFPFEEAWYRQRGVPAEFVGHPLAELPRPSVTRDAFAALHGLDPGKPWVALLPGSRPREISLNLPEMLRAAALLGSGYEYVVPLAPTLTSAQELKVRAGTGPELKFTRDARAALFHARASVVASGTATVEAALMGNPFVVVYRLSQASYAVAKRAVRVPHVAMPNLIAGRRMVPELIQDGFTAEAVANALRPLLDETAERRAMLASLHQIRMALERSSGTIEAVAAHVLSFLPGSNPMTARP